MAMRRVGAGWLFAGAFVILALPCFAQTEQSTPADPAAKSEQAAPTEPVANPERTVTVEAGAKPDHAVPPEAQTKSESTAPAAEPKAKIESTAASEPVAKTESVAPSEPTAKAEEPAKSEPTPKIETSTATDVPTDAMPMVEAFVARLDKSTRAIHENSKKDPALIREGCRNLVNEILDLDTMTKAVNVEIWDKMTPAQRETIRAAFEHRMVGNCVHQFVGYEGELLKLAGVRTAQGGNLLATVRVGSREDGQIVTWRLQHSGADRWRAVDVITEGRSAVTDARNEFAAVLESVNGDIEALIAFMQK